jgi:hypothetical protein
MRKSIAQRGGAAALRERIERGSNGSRLMKS